MAMTMLTMMRMMTIRMRMRMRMRMMMVMMMMMTTMMTMMMMMNPGVLRWRRTSTSERYRFILHACIHVCNCMSLSLYPMLCRYMAVGQNLVPLVNIKIAGKWMFIPLKMVLIGIDPYPYVERERQGNLPHNLQFCFPMFVAWYYWAQSPQSLLLVTHHEGSSEISSRKRSGFLKKNWTLENSRVKHIEYVELKSDFAWRQQRQNLDHCFEKEIPSRKLT